MLKIRFKLAIFCLVLSQSIMICVSSVTQAAEVDRQFIFNVVQHSDCVLGTNLENEFPEAIDRLEAINPNLVTYIRSVSYKKTLSLLCDLPESSDAIWYKPSEQTIHLRVNARTDWKTSASFFHEFLHFVGVKIDHAYHDNPKMENVVEVDSVYACHVTVFPKLLEYVKMDPSRLTAATLRCASAVVE